MIKETLARVVNRQDLSEEEMIVVMEEIMSGACTPAQIGAFITALRMKGESVAEITGAARVMREKATRIKVEAEIVVDTCGTGGDASNTFNVSTTAAFVIAAAGVKVAKHGNRAVSSRCGSADILEALGANLDLSPALVAAAIGAVGFGFLFAPKLHLAMKHAIGPRRETGLRTIFNILGPLTNPAGANVQVLGVYDGNLTNTLATVLKNLGSRAAMVVFGEGGFDELSIVGPTWVSELKGGAVRDYVVQPEDFGLKRAAPAEIAGGDAAKNVQIVRSIFAGEKGACRDMVVLNAAGALAISGKARDMSEGVRMAEELIDSGAAGKKLEEYITFSRKAA
ncbi:MAG: anthranilate phosphoribosyltransferase, partial [Deltaproteobacteria bacterium]|nr:anthranilate phosphoribosyltransferase [Deltaproteobacteria bacterium]